MSLDIDHIVFNFDDENEVLLRANVDSDSLKRIREVSDAEILRRFWKLSLEIVDVC